MKRKKVSILLKIIIIALIIILSTIGNVRAENFDQGFAPEMSGGSSGAIASDVASGEVGFSTLEGDNFVLCDEHGAELNDSHKGKPAIGNYTNINPADYTVSRYEYSSLGKYTATPTEAWILAQTPTGGTVSHWSRPSQWAWWAHGRAQGSASSSASISTALGALDLEDVNSPYTAIFNYNNILGASSKTKDKTKEETEAKEEMDKKVKDLETYDVEKTLKSIYGDSIPFSKDEINEIKKFVKDNDITSDLLLYNALNSKDDFKDNKNINDLKEKIFKSFESSAQANYGNTTTDFSIKEDEFNDFVSEYSTGNDFETYSNNFLNGNKLKDEYKAKIYEGKLEKDEKGKLVISEGTTTSFDEKNRVWLVGPITMQYANYVSSSAKQGQNRFAGITELGIEAKYKDGTTSELKYNSQAQLSDLNGQKGVYTFLRYEPKKDDYKFSNASESYDYLPSNRTPFYIAIGYDEDIEQIVNFHFAQKYLTLNNATYTVYGDGRYCNFDIETKTTISYSFIDKAGEQQSGSSGPLDGKVNAESWVKSHVTGYEEGTNCSVSSKVTYNAKQGDIGQAQDLIEVNEINFAYETGKASISIPWTTDITIEKEVVEEASGKDINPDQTFYVSVLVNGEDGQEDEILQERLPLTVTTPTKVIIPSYAIEKGYYIVELDEHGVSFEAWNNGLGDRNSLWKDYTPENNGVYEGVYEDENDSNNTVIHIKNTKISEKYATIEVQKKYANGSFDSSDEFYFKVNIKHNGDDDKEYRFKINPTTIGGKEEELKDLNSNEVIGYYQTDNSQNGKNTIYARIENYTWYDDTNPVITVEETDQYGEAYTENPSHDDSVWKNYKLGITSNTEGTLQNGKAYISTFENEARPISVDLELLKEIPNYEDNSKAGFTVSIERRKKDSIEDLQLLNTTTLNVEANSGKPATYNYTIDNVDKDSYYMISLSEILNSKFNWTGFLDKNLSDNDNYVTMEGIPDFANVAKENLGKWVICKENDKIVQATMMFDSILGAKNQFKITATNTPKDDSKVTGFTVRKDILQYKEKPTIDPETNPEGYEMEASAIEKLNESNKEKEDKFYFQIGYRDENNNFINVTDLCFDNALLNTNYNDTYGSMLELGYNAELGEYLVDSKVIDWKTIDEEFAGNKNLEIIELDKYCQTEEEFNNLKDDEKQEDSIWNLYTETSDEFNKNITLIPYDDKAALELAKMKNSLPTFVVKNVKSYEGSITLSKEVIGEWNEDDVFYFVIEPINGSMDDKDDIYSYFNKNDVVTVGNKQAIKITKDNPKVSTNKNIKWTSNEKNPQFTITEVDKYGTRYHGDDKSIYKEKSIWLKYAPKNYGTITAQILPQDNNSSNCEFTTTFENKNIEVHKKHTLTLKKKIDGNEIDSNNKDGFYFQVFEVNSDGNLELVTQKYFDESDTDDFIRLSSKTQSITSKEFEGNHSFVIKEYDNVGGIEYSEYLEGEMESKFWSKYTPSNGTGVWYVNVTENSKEAIVAECNNKENKIEESEYVNMQLVKAFKDLNGNFTSAPVDFPVQEILCNVYLDGCIGETVIVNNEEVKVLNVAKEDPYANGFKKYIQVKVNIDGSFTNIKEIKIKKDSKLNYRVVELDQNGHSYNDRKKFQQDTMWNYTKPNKQGKDAEPGVFEGTVTYGEGKSGKVPGLVKIFNTVRKVNISLTKTVYDSNGNKSPIADGERFVFEIVYNGDESNKETVNIEKGKEKYEREFLLTFDEELTYKITETSAYVDEDYDNDVLGTKFIPVNGKDVIEGTVKEGTDGNIPLEGENLRTPYTFLPIEKIFVDKSSNIEIDYNQAFYFKVKSIDGKNDYTNVFSDLDALIADNGKVIEVKANEFNEFKYISNVVNWTAEDDTIEIIEVDQYGQTEEEFNESKNKQEDSVWNKYTELDTKNYRLQLYDSEEDAVFALNAMDTAMNPDINLLPEEESALINYSKHENAQKLQGTISLVKNVIGDADKDDEFYFTFEPFKFDKNDKDDYLNVDIVKTYFKKENIKKLKNGEYAVVVKGGETVTSNIIEWTSDKNCPHFYINEVDQYGEIWYGDESKISHSDSTWYKYQPTRKNLQSRITAQLIASENYNSVFDFNNERKDRHITITKKIENNEEIDGNFYFKVTEDGEDVTSKLFDVDKKGYLKIDKFYNGITSNDIFGKHTYTITEYDENGVSYDDYANKNKESDFWGKKYVPSNLDSKTPGVWTVTVGPDNEDVQFTAKNAEVVTGLTVKKEIAEGTSKDDYNNEKFDAKLIVKPNTKYSKLFIKEKDSNEFKPYENGKEYNIEISAEKPYVLSDYITWIGDAPIWYVIEDLSDKEGWLLSGYKVNGAEEVSDINFATLSVKQDENTIVVVNEKIPNNETALQIVKSLVEKNGNTILLNNNSPEFYFDIYLNNYAETEYTYSDSNNQGETLNITPITDITDETQARYADDYEGYIRVKLQLQYNENTGFAPTYTVANLRNIQVKPGKDLEYKIVEVDQYGYSYEDREQSTDTSNGESIWKITKPYNGTEEFNGIWEDSIQESKMEEGAGASVSAYNEMRIAQVIFKKYLINQYRFDELKEDFHFKANISAVNEDGEERTLFDNWKSEDIILNEEKEYFEEEYVLNYNETLKYEFTEVSYDKDGNLVTYEDYLSGEKECEFWDKYEPRGNGVISGEVKVENKRNKRYFTNVGMTNFVRQFTFLPIEKIISTNSDIILDKDTAFYFKVKSQDEKEDYTDLFSDTIDTENNGKVIEIKANDSNDIKYISEIVEWKSISNSNVKIIEVDQYGQTQDEFNKLEEKQKDSNWNKYKEVSKEKEYKLTIYDSKDTATDARNTMVTSMDEEIDLLPEEENALIEYYKEDNAKVINGSISLGKKVYGEVDEDAEFYFTIEPAEACKQEKLWDVDWVKTFFNEKNIATKGGKSVVVVPANKVVTSNTIEWTSDVLTPMFTIIEVDQYGKSWPGSIDKIEDAESTWYKYQPKYEENRVLGQLIGNFNYEFEHIFENEKNDRKLTLVKTIENGNFEGPYYFKLTEDGKEVKDLFDVNADGYIEVNNKDGIVSKDVYGAHKYTLTEYAKEGDKYVSYKEYLDGEESDFWANRYIADNNGVWNIELNKENKNVTFEAKNIALNPIGIEITKWTEDEYKDKEFYAVYSIIKNKYTDKLFIKNDETGIFEEVSGYTSEPVPVSKSKPYVRTDFVSWVGDAPIFVVNEILDPDFDLEGYRVGQAQILDKATGTKNANILYIHQEENVIEMVNTPKKEELDNVSIHLSKKILDEDGKPTTLEEELPTIYFNVYLKNYNGNGKVKVAGKTKELIDVDPEDVNGNGYEKYIQVPIKFEIDKSTGRTREEISVSITDIELEKGSTIEYKVVEVDEKGNTYANKTEDSELWNVIQPTKFSNGKWGSIDGIWSGELNKTTPVSDSAIIDAYNKLGEEEIENATGIRITKDIESDNLSEADKAKEFTATYSIIKSEGTTELFIKNDENGEFEPIEGNAYTDVVKVSVNNPYTRDDFIKWEGEAPTFKVNETKEPGYAIRGYRVEESADPDMNNNSIAISIEGDNWIEMVNAPDAVGIKITKAIESDELTQEDKEKVFTATYSITKSEGTTALFIKNKNGDFEPIEENAYTGTVPVSVNEPYSEDNFIDWEGEPPIFKVDEVKDPNFELVGYRIDGEGDITSNNSIAISFEGQNLIEMVNKPVIPEKGSIVVSKSIVDLQGKSITLNKDNLSEIRKYLGLKEDDSLEFKFNVYLKNYKKDVVTLNNKSTKLKNVDSKDTNGKGYEKYIPVSIKFNINKEKGTTNSIETATISDIDLPNDGSIEYKIVEVDEKGNSYENRTKDSKLWKITKPGKFSNGKWGSSKGIWTGSLNTENPTSKTAKIDAYNVIRKIKIVFEKLVDGTPIQDDETFYFDITYDDAHKDKNKEKYEITKNNPKYEEEFILKLDEKLHYEIKEVDEKGETYEISDKKSKIWSNFKPADGKGIKSGDIDKDTDGTIKLDGANLTIIIPNTAGIKITKDIQSDNLSNEDKTKTFKATYSITKSEGTTSLFIKNEQTGELELIKEKAYTSTEDVSVNDPFTRDNFIAWEGEAPTFKVDEIADPDFELVGYKVNGEGDITSNNSITISLEGPNWIEMVNKPVILEKGSIQISKSIVDLNGKTITLSEDNLKEIREYLKLKENEPLTFYFNVYLKNYKNDNVILNGESVSLKSVDSKDSNGKGYEKYIQVPIEFTIDNEKGTTNSIETATISDIDLPKGESIEYKIVEVDKDGKAYNKDAKDGLWKITKPGKFSNGKWGSSDGIWTGSLNTENPTSKSAKVDAYNAIRKIKIVFEKLVDGTTIQDDEKFYFDITYDEAHKDKNKDGYEITIENQKYEEEFILKLDEKLHYEIKEVDENGKTYEESDKKSEIWSKFKPEDGKGIKEDDIDKDFDGSIKLTGTNLTNKPKNYYGKIILTKSVVDNNKTNKDDAEHVKEYPFYFIIEQNGENVVEDLAIDKEVDVATVNGENAIVLYAGDIFTSNTITWNEGDETPTYTIREVDQEGRTYKEYQELKDENKSSELWDKFEPTYKDAVKKTFEQPSYSEEEAKIVVNEIRHDETNTINEETYSFKITKKSNGGPIEDGENFYFQIATDPEDKETILDADKLKELFGTEYGQNQNVIDTAKGLVHLFKDEEAGVTMDTVISDEIPVSDIYYVIEVDQYGNRIDDANIPEDSLWNTYTIEGSSNGVFQATEDQPNIDVNNIGENISKIYIRKELKPGQSSDKPYKFEIYKDNEYYDTIELLAGQTSDAIEFTWKTNETAPSIGVLEVNTKATPKITISNNPDQEFEQKLVDAVDKNGNPITDEDGNIIQVPELQLQPENNNLYTFTFENDVMVSGNVTITKKLDSIDSNTPGPEYHFQYRYLTNGQDLDISEEEVPWTDIYVNANSSKDTETISWNVDDPAPIVEIREMDGNVPSDVNVEGVDEKNNDWKWDEDTNIITGTVSEQSKAKVNVIFTNNKWLSGAISLDKSFIDREKSFSEADLLEEVSDLYNGDYTFTFNVTVTPGKDSMFVHNGVSYPNEVNTQYVEKVEIPIKDFIEFYKDENNKGIPYPIIDSLTVSWPDGMKSPTYVVKEDATGEFYVSSFATAGVVEAVGDSKEISTEDMQITPDDLNKVSIVNDYEESRRRAWQLVTEMGGIVWDDVEIPNKVITEEETDIKGGHDGRYVEGGYHPKNTSEQFNDTPLEGIYVKVARVLYRNENGNLVEYARTYNGEPTYILESSDGDEQKLVPDSIPFYFMFDRNVQYDVTGEDGHWSVDKISVPALTESEANSGLTFENGWRIRYDVEFYYDGVTYEPTDFLVDAKGNVDKYLENPNDSKYFNNSFAIDNEEDRNNYNSKYSTVTGDTKMDADGNSKGKIGDATVNYKASINNDFATSVGTVDLGANKDNYEDVYNKATTANAGLKYFLSDIRNEDVLDMELSNTSKEYEFRIVKRDGIEYIEYEYYFMPVLNYGLNINLGLVKKSKADVEVSKSIEAATIIINEKAQVYKFENGKAKLNSDDMNEDILDQISRIVDKRKEEEKQKLNIYTSDYAYRVKAYGENTDLYNAYNKFYNAIYGHNADEESEEFNNLIKSKELQIYLTYRITLANNSMYDVAIHSIDDYSESTLEYVDVLNGYNADKEGTQLESTPGLYAYITDEDYGTGTDKNNDKAKLTNLFANHDNWCNWSFTAKEYEEEGFAGKVTINNIDHVFNKATINLSEVKPEDQEYDGYKLPANEQSKFYTTYRVSDYEKVKDGEFVLGDKRNYAEVSSFTAYYKGTANPSAVIDEDSAPANYNLSQNTYTVHEDDTSYGQVNIGTESNNTRSISGTAWLDRDDIDGSEEKNGQKLGNSKIDDDDYRLKNITTKLVEVVDIPTVENGNVTNNYTEYEYYWDTGSEVKTTQDGYYYINSNKIDGMLTNGLVAGNYEVRFFYGDNSKVELYDKDGRVENDSNYPKINGIDYKTTAYEKNISFDDYVNNEWLALDSSEGDNEARDNEARDNEARRLALIEKTQVLNNKNTAIFNVANYDSKDKYVEASRSRLDYEKLNTDAPNFESDYTNYMNQLFVKPSYDNSTTAYNGIINADNYTMFADSAKINLKVESNDEADSNSGNAIENVNFGLEKRSKTNIILDKQVKEITFTNTENEFFHVEYDIYYGTEEGFLGNMENNPDIEYNKISEGLWVALVPKADTLQGMDILTKVNDSLEDGTREQGFLYVNVDSLVLQDLNVTIKYQITAINLSETDTYGEQLDKIMKIDTIEAREKSFDRAIEELSSPDYVLEKADNKSGLLKHGESEDITKIDSDLVNDEYKTYGKYLGHTYYQGFGDWTTKKDKIVKTTVRQVVEYVDNDISILNNSDATENQDRWNIIKANDSNLMNYIDKNVFVNGQILNEIEQPYGDNHIAITNTADKTFVKPLKPLASYTNYDELPEDVQAITYITLSDTKSATDIGDYGVDNYAEIVEIENPVGGNREVGVYGNFDPRGGAKSTKEVDETSTEIVTLSPPTGNIDNDRKTATAIAIIIAFALVSGAGTGIALKISQKRKKDKE